MIRRLEELSLNALPALQTSLADGWVLRFAAGYTGRANSVWPLYPAHVDLPAKVAAAEAWYQARGLPPTFKLTEAAEPAGLEAFLAARGYQRQKPTSLQTTDLRGQAWPAPADLHLTEAVTPEWRAAYAALGGLTAQAQATLAAMLAGLPAAVVGVWLGQPTAPVACGLGVLQDGHLGLYDIITHPAVRRQGLGRQVVAALLGWGQRQGAQTAYLQVMVNNLPALNLYAQFGFREAYRYWYRQLAG